MKNITFEEARRLISEGESQTHEQRMAAAHERLRGLVLYAKEHSPYFRNAYKNIGEKFNLEDLPITTKAGLMDCYDRWPTDSEVTEESVRAYLADVENVSKSYLGRYTALSTSGTTGAPTPMVRDSYHNTIHGCLLNQRLMRDIDAEKINFFVSKTAAVIATDGFVSSYSSALRMKSRLGEKADNLLILSILTPIAELVSRLNSFCPEIITGYPSVLSVLAREKLEGRLNATPHFIASSAEKMSRDSYELLRKAFNCPVLDNYCSTEGGEIAMSCREGHLHLNDDWVLLEPVDDDMKHVAPGQWSTGALITDLTNYVQPIIRYHVNDCVRFSGQSGCMGEQDATRPTNPCECGSNLPVLEIMGRMGDTICLNGIYLTTPVAHFMLTDIPNILNWQLIQTKENSVELRIIEAYGANRAETAVVSAQKLKAALRTYGCGEIEVASSDEEFLKSPRGGKSPLIVNKVK